MYNITLIGTHHSDLGKSNSDELHNIIESISPTVIFIELSEDLFDRVYIRNQLANEPSEIKSTKRYLLKHNIEIIPVDIEPYKNLPLSDIEYMFNEFKRYNVYKKLDDELYKMTKKDGYPFLNSKECMELHEKKRITEKDLMQFMMNQNQLLRIHKLFYEEQEIREKEMLRNIYNYSKENRYETAVFTIGAGHRKSLMQKIQEYKSKEELKLNWTFYDGLSN